MHESEAGIWDSVRLIRLESGCILTGPVRKSDLFFMLHNNIDEYKSNGNR